MRKTVAPSLPHQASTRLSRDRQRVVHSPSVFRSVGKGDVSAIILAFSIVSTRISSWVGIASRRLDDLENNVAISAVLNLKVRLGPFGIYLSS